MQHPFSLLAACWLRCKFCFYQKIIKNSSYKNEDLEIVLGALMTLDK